MDNVAAIAAAKRTADEQATQKREPSYISPRGSYSLGPRGHSEAATRSFSVNLAFVSKEISLVAAAAYGGCIGAVELLHNAFGHFTAPVAQKLRSLRVQRMNDGLIRTARRGGVITTTTTTMKRREVDIGKGKKGEERKETETVGEDLMRDNSESLEGKLCIVTGGGAGVGLITAKELLTRGAHVIIACRSGSEAVEQLRQNMTSGIRRAEAGKEPGEEKEKEGGASVEFIPLDLSSFRSILEFSEIIRARGTPVDVLVNNAGIMTPPQHSLTEDGFERQFQVNYLGHFLLTWQLLLRSRQNQKLNVDHHRLPQTLPLHPPKTSFSSSLSFPPPSSSSPSLPPTPPPSAAVVAAAAALNEEGRQVGVRVVNLTSTTHHSGKIHFDDVNFIQRYHAFHAYAQSKLAVDLWTKELDRRYRDSHVVAVSVHPGLIDTALARGYFLSLVPQFASKLINPLFPIFLKPVPDALDTMMYAITAPSEEVAGAYVADAHVAKCGRICYDVLLAERLWNYTTSLLPLSSPK